MFCAHNCQRLSANLWRLSISDANLAYITCKFSREFAPLTWDRSSWRRWHSSVVLIVASSASIFCRLIDWSKEVMPLTYRNGGGGGGGIVAAISQDHSMSPIAKNSLYPLRLIPYVFRLVNSLLWGTVSEQKPWRNLSYVWYLRRSGGPSPSGNLAVEWCGSIGFWSRVDDTSSTCS